MPGESGLHQGFQIILECVVGSNFFSHLDCFKENVGQIRLFYDQNGTQMRYPDLEKEDSCVTV